MEESFYLASEICFVQLKLKSARNFAPTAGLYWNSFFTKFWEKERIRSSGREKIDRESNAI